MAAEPERRPARSGPSRLARRSVLKGALAGLAWPALDSLLAACGGDGGANANLAAEKIPAPDNPIRWPLSKANPPIDSGLTPKRGSTLRIYNYADYVSPQVLKDFEKKYGVDIRLSTFNDADEALTKIASKNLKFDLYFPSYDSLGRLVAADLLLPLTHDYMPNSKNLWSNLHNPWYDKGWRYSMPYTVYSTGIGWRTDRVVCGRPGGEPVRRPLGPEVSGSMAVLDDWHTAMGMVLLRNGHSTSTARPRRTSRWCASSCCSCGTP